MAESPPRCAYCEGKLGLLVSRYWHLRFCSRHHKEAYLKQEQERLHHFKRRLGYLEQVPADESKPPSLKR